MNRRNFGKSCGAFAAITSVVVACTSIVAAAPVQAGTPAIPQSGGWATVVNPISDRLHLTGVHTVLIAGAASQNGDCSFPQSGTVPAGGAPFFAEQLAVDFSQCTEQILEGTPSQADLSYLNSLDPTGDSSVATGSPNDLGTSTESSTAPSAPSTPGLATAAPLAAAAAASSSAYLKTGWKDPVGILITSLAANLAWNYTPSLVKSASYTTIPHEFKYDGWSNTGTPTPPFNFTTKSVAIQANETFTNTDFEQLLLTTAAAAGGIEGAATIIAACGFSTAPAVFTHRLHIKGNSDGSYDWSYNDSATGGCSDLVTSGVLYGGHFLWTGFGSIS